MPRQRRCRAFLYPWRMNVRPGPLNGRIRVHVSTSRETHSDTDPWRAVWERSEEHTSELQSLMRISYAVFCLKKKTTTQQIHNPTPIDTLQSQQYPCRER